MSKLRRDVLVQNQDLDEIKEEDTQRLTQSLFVGLGDFTSIDSSLIHGICVNSHDSSGKIIRRSNSANINSLRKIRKRKIDRKNKCKSGEYES